mgnify:CR=1 FL=1
MNPTDILKFIGIPVAVATGVMLLSWWVLASKRLQPLGATIAVGVACLTAFILQDGPPAFPPTEKWHWLVFTVLIVFLLACLYPFFRAWDRLIVLQAIIAGIIGIILGALVLSGINAATKNMTDYPFTNPTVPIPYILGALFLMVVLGTLIGLIPAHRAISIKPIDALREE